MAVLECPNGHLYDSNLYSACPYCRGGSNMINFDQGNKTTAPGGFGSPSNATVAPDGYAQQAVNQTVPIHDPAEDVGKTVAPESYIRQAAEENKTVAAFQKQYDLDPVVGWLVCVEGAGKGRSYELYARINAIGRGSGNDVCIQGDATISRERHARLAYDPRHNSYQLIPGESTNNIYLNDQPVYVPAKLEAYDLVELGESKFLFIPLCGDRFRWEATS